MNRRLLLCMDLDRTVLPNGAQPESPGARALFSALADRPGVTLAYVTGRDRRLVGQAITNYRLPQPDYVIGDVGTTIYAVHDGDWEPRVDWEQTIAPDWAGLAGEDIHGLLDALKRLFQLKE